MTDSASGLYARPLTFEWDGAKDARCQRDRGFSFEYAALAFADRDHLIEPDDRIDYGEIRFRLIGEIEERLYVVIFTIRGQSIRIISARKANRREQVHYDARQVGR